MAMDKLNRLKELLDTYGADSARWPDADRLALADILEGHNELIAEYRAAAEVDQVLAAATKPVVPVGARARLAELEPHLLADIGLDEKTAQSEAQRSVWDAPDTWKC